MYGGMGPATSRGFVRPARRPQGWVAPGPAPRTPVDRPDLWPGEREELCHLAGNWRILQRRDGHRWSLDDLVTAWFAIGQTHEHPPLHILDLGCGIGAVLLLLAWRFPAARCVGVEAQELSVRLAARSIAWNGVDDRCEVRLGDLRDQTWAPEGPVYDLITGTPPYLALGTATAPTRRQQVGCHMEQRGGIEEYCAVAARLLRAGSRFVVCHTAPSRTEAAAVRAGLVAVARRAVIPRAGKPPLFWVFALARTDGRTGTQDHEPLIVRDRGGQRTPAFRALRAAMGMP
jgi:tRNA1Val (adenine37-N6)-methyltransferase